jgi:hypothetical protein
MPIDAALERTWAADAAWCLAEFKAAIADAKEGRFARGKALIERVRARGGDAMADVARAELRKHAGVSA